MNLKIRNHIFFGILCVCFCSNAYNQSRFTKPLEPYTDPTIIRDNNIKSLTIFAEAKESDYSEDMGDVSKIVEMEFNNDGYFTYKIASGNQFHDPYFGYEGTRIMLLITYDQRNQVISRYIEDDFLSKEEIKEYNNEGNVARLQFVLDKDTTFITDFVWIGDNMVKSIIVKRLSPYIDRMVQYNEQGRIIQLKRQSRLVNIKYEQKSDTLITTTTTKSAHYTLGEVSTIEIRKTLLKFNRTISYEKMDHTGKLEIEMNATLDKNGNATYFYFYNVDWQIPFSYNIQNYYDDRNLLTKRMFYHNRVPDRYNDLVKIERYFFEDDTLIFKLQKGNLYNNEQSCEGGDGCDMGDF